MGSGGTGTAGHVIVALTYAGGGFSLNNHLLINGATYPFGSFLRVPR